MTDAAVPLIEAAGARVAIDGRASLTLDCVVAGPRLVVGGDVGPLLSLLMNLPMGAAMRARAVEAFPLDPEGVATVASGTIALAGHDVGSGAHVRHVGAAPFDPPLPPDFTVRGYVEWSARLADLGKLVRSRSMEALERVGLQKAASRLLRTLSPVEKRVLLLAHAAVASPAVIVAETPIADLDGEAAAFVMTALSRVCEGRASILSVARVTPGTPEATLVERADHLLYVSGGELLLSGPPREILARGRHYGLTVSTNVDALRAELETRGLSLTGGPARFSVALPEGKETSDILAAASAARAAVVELLALM